MVPSPKLPPVNPSSQMVILHPSIPPWRSNYHIPPSISSHLQQTPWCASILSDPKFTPILFHHRNPPPHLTGRYSFFSETLNTPRTFAVWEAFYRTAGSITRRLRRDMRDHRARGGAGRASEPRPGGCIGYDSRRGGRDYRVYA